MFDIARRRPLVSLAVVAGLLVAAVPAGAHEASQKAPQSGLSSSRAHGMAGRHVGSGSGRASKFSSYVGPGNDGIIAVLIGL
jgi:hypothetical protein